MTPEDKVLTAMDIGKPASARQIARRVCDDVGVVRGALQKLEAVGCVKRYPAQQGTMRWELLRRPEAKDAPPRRRVVRGCTLAPLPPWEAAQ